MESHRLKQIDSLSDLGKELVEEIEHFFITYNQLHAREFKPLGSHGRKRATKLAKEGQIRYRREQAKDARELLCRRQGLAQ
jgi:inorganic pyrophosphatase